MPASTSIVRFTCRFDNSEQDAAQLEATAERITSSGYDSVLSTWLNTQVWRIDVSWLAIGR